jgi:hypothetical protein
LQPARYDFLGAWPLGNIKPHTEGCPRSLLTELGGA